MMNLTQRTIAELVVDDYRRATVFKQYGIDFCCGGNVTLESVCEKKGIVLEDIQRALEAAEARASGESVRADGWSLDFLADYIINEHHTYVRESIPVLQEFTRKVARVHGAGNPEVVEIAHIFDEVAVDMSRHMMKEEQMLFPYIKRLVETQNSNVELGQPGFGTVRNPIRMMEHEHDQAGEMMREIRRLSNDFTPPEYACNTYRVSFAKLEEFEDDLHRHVHLENNILFPKSVELEDALRFRHVA